jgi:hypothetical protein
MGPGFTVLRSQCQARALPHPPSIAAFIPSHLLALIFLVTHLHLTQGVLGGSDANA